MNRLFPNRMAIPALAAVALFVCAGAAQATDISGNISSPLTLFDDSRLVGDVTCTVPLTVTVAAGGLRYSADYPVVAVAACVPKELARNINWADPSPPQFQGDGLLIVRAADDPASGVIIFL